MLHILVTGGTGTLGRQLLPRLQEAGCAIRVLSRSTHEAKDGIEYLRGDLNTGEGVADAMQGIDVIVHCAGSQKGDEVRTKNLVQAAAGSTVRHLVYISVVGADRVPVVSGFDRAAFGYFASKRAAELVVMNSGIPWTILRATQFHDLTFIVAQALAKMPIMPVIAGNRFQPVDTSEVAARLAELALAEPAGLVPDLGGPRIYSMADLMRSYLHTTGKRRLIVPIWMPGQAARANRNGANLTPNHADGKRTWEAFLADRLG